MGSDYDQWPDMKPEGGKRLRLCERLRTADPIYGAADDIGDVGRAIGTGGQVMN